MSNTTLKISIIIPTFNREEDLKKCIKSILDQTIKPHEIIIVDDGDLGKFPLEDQCKKFNIHCVYLKKDKKGVVYSRNLGSKIAQGDIIFLLEDDVVLFPNYIEEMLKVYKKFKNIGGVGGVIANSPKMGVKDFFMWLISLLFLNRGFKEGKILPSGFGTDYNSTPFPIKKIEEVDFLPGGVSSFKKEIFNEFQFSEKYQTETGYAQGEDREFSYRVSRKYKLLLNPQAKLYHFSSPKTNFNKKIRGRAYVFFYYLFFKDHLSDKWYRKILFWYALSGFVFIRTIAMLFFFKKREIDRMKGIINALKDIITGKKINHV
ncbi:MAG: glycosyltransferase [Desulfonauticus sp.]|nr:glycosyltransferase [Desulfonauticus sp.]